jgi:phage major head subunit gpT-like protein
VRFDSADKKRAALDAFFAGNWREGYTSFRQAYADIMGVRGALDTEDLNRRILRESAAVNGETFDGRMTESATSATWGFILGDSIARRMVTEYGREDWQVWRQLVSTFPLNDFRTQRIDRLGAYALLPAVGQGAAYQPLTTPGNEEASYAATKRGGTEDLTLETIANDDIRIISRLPQRLGIAAAETLFKFVLDFFIAPIVTTYDATATFAAGHGNTATLALNDTNLSAAWTAMISQTELGGPTSFLPVQPKTLLIPPALRQMGLVLCQSAVAVPSGIAAASNIPNVNQGLNPVIIPYWAATSSTAWFLAADPARTPGIEIGFYQGKEDPELFVQTDQTVGSMFNADKLTFKLRHIYGGTVIDHRGLYRGNV